MKIRKLLPFLFLAVLASCGGANDDDSVTPDPDPTATGPVAEYLAIPEFGPDDMVDPGSFRMTNAGLYFGVMKDDPNDSYWIYRMQIHSGPTPRWLINRHNDFLHGFLPNSLFFERQDEFSVLAWDLQNWGSFNINNSMPNSFNNPTPSATIAASADFLLKDYGTLPSTWFIADKEVQIKRPTSGNTWDVVPNTVALNGFQVVEPDDDGQETSLWAASGSKLYKISFSAVQFVADLTATGNPLEDMILKIRVINDKVYAGTSKSVYEINSTSHAVYKLHDYAQTSLGISEFAVDGGHVYTRDGKKIDLTFYKVSDIFPAAPVPTSGNQQAYLDYIMAISEFGGSPIETSSDIMSNYIYGYSNSKRQIFRVKKKYQ